MSGFNNSDEFYMRRALELALQGQYTARPNPIVGAVIVKDNKIIGEGAHLRAGEPHAEIHALRQAGEKAKGSTCYVTLEPCCHWGRTGPCVEALIQAGISKVIFAMRDPNPKVNGQSIEKLKAAGIEVAYGVLEQEAKNLNPGFISRMVRKRPYVRAKIAASLDGRTALANGQSQWITGKEARQDVQYLRARSSVIISGRGTVEIDNPSLTVRQNDWPEKWSLEIIQPVRIICDSAFQINQNLKSLKLYETESPVWIAHANPNKKSEPEGIYLPNSNHQVDLEGLIRWCYEQDFSEVLIEAGSSLTGAFLEQNLIDEFWIYLAPCFLGPEAAPMVRLPSLKNLQGIGRWEIQSQQLIGQDLRIILKR